MTRFQLGLLEDSDDDCLQPPINRKSRRLSGNDLLSMTSHRAGSSYRERPHVSHVRHTRTMKRKSVSISNAMDGEVKSSDITGVLHSTYFTREGD